MMLFKVGDYVTGLDRSYRRSIYQVVDMYDTNLNLPAFSLKFIVLNGRLGQDGELYERMQHEFRHAPPEEVKYELGIAYTLILIRMVEQLIN
jgi:hypothetical protein